MHGQKVCGSRCYCKKYPEGPSPEREAAGNPEAVVSPAWQAVMATAREEAGDLHRPAVACKGEGQWPGRARVRR